MKRYMLDTNLCIELLRGRAGHVFDRLRRLRVDQVMISTITLAELQYGAAKSARRAHHETLLLQFCAPLDIAPFDSVAATTYGGLRQKLERSGTPIGPLDTLIAAHALACRAILLTRNEREFRRVSNLRVENWLEG